MTLESISAEEVILSGTKNLQYSSTSAPHTISARLLNFPKLQIESFRKKIR